MFSVQPSESNPRIPLTVAVVLATLLLAFALSALATLQVRDEYRLLGSWASRARPVPKAEILALRRDIGTRIIIRSVATAVLLLCTLATLWLQQRQLAIRRALDRVKLLARDVLASLNQGVITTDDQSVVTSINAAAVNLLGVDPDCVGKPVASISSAEVPLEALSRQVTERRGPSGDRELAVERGGRTVRLVLSALELKEMRGATLGCVINLRDVTERMLMKEQVWRMQQFASLSTLASGLHHEIKNPIMALSIHVQLLEERLLGTDAARSVAEPIGVLKAEVRRLNSTLESFRNFASLERLRLEPVDVEGLLEDTARLISPQAAGQGVRLEFRRAEGGPLPRPPLDPEKVRQAVLNLVLNALEAMPGGGELGLGAARAGGSLRVMIRDTGPGIPPEVQEHIFHPYFSTKDRGTGIGLALAEKLVRQHDGRLDFRTGPAGTTFTITLPVSGPGRSDAPP